MSTPYSAASSTRTNEFPEYKDTHGEDPARFLESNELMATARIAGIRDADLLEAYEDVADQITTGSYRTTILEAIADRKADLGLTDELADAPTPDTDPSPATATDGGQVTEDSGTELEFDESDAHADEPETADDDALHPDVRGLEAGEVARFDRGETTEYVWPATREADEPYLMRVFDDEDTERTSEPLTLSIDEYRGRMDIDRDRLAVGLIDVRAPSAAATNGGAE